MDDRRKLRAVVDRKFVETIVLLGLLVDLGICTTDEPKHGWRTPFGSERPEILARRCWSGFSNAFCAEVPTEGIDNPFARVAIVRVERIAIQGRDLWFTWRSRRVGFGIDDPLNRGQDAAAHARIECPHIQFDDGLIRN